MNRLALTSSFVYVVRYTLPMNFSILSIEENRQYDNLLRMSKYI
jgi:hypothetical protein